MQASLETKCPQGTKIVIFLFLFILATKIPATKSIIELHAQNLVHKLANEQDCSNFSKNTHLHECFSNAHYCLEDIIHLDDNECTIIKSVVEIFNCKSADKTHLHMRIVFEKIEHSSCEVSAHYYCTWRSVNPLRCAKLTWPWLWMHKHIIEFSTLIILLFKINCAANYQCSFRKKLTTSIMHYLPIYYCKYAELKYYSLYWYSKECVICSRIDVVHYHLLLVVCLCRFELPSVQIHANVLGKGAYVLL